MGRIFWKIAKVEKLVALEHAILKWWWLFLLVEDIQYQVHVQLNVQLIKQRLVVSKPIFEVTLPNALRVFSSPLRRAIYCSYRLIMPGTLQVTGCQ